MKKTILTGLLLHFLVILFAQNKYGYTSLDPSDPLTFNGDHIIYKSEKIQLGPMAFFIDGQLSDEVVATHPYVFNSVNKAAAQLTNGTQESPMKLYIAPYVYWIDDPDDTAIRVGVDGAAPYGLIVKCDWLTFYGLTENPANVVLACNRGQTIGAKGNFTMFRFYGQGTASENITFGNYCNVDLNYPLKPNLSRKKRASAIVQAQLILCDGDKILARNTRFISRLNLCPFVGAKRALFDRCHFESTDDALCGTGVYINCDFDVYGSKPFYRTTGTGAVFLNCDIRSHTSKQQFFTKANGQLCVVDTRINSAPGTYIGWNDDMPLQARNYQYHVTQNNKLVIIGKKDPASTIELAGQKLLHAYRLVNDGKVLYNTYNLLRGNDEWDPMNVKQKIMDAGKMQSDDFTSIPVQLKISPASSNIETNKNNALLTASMMRFGNYPFSGEKIKWAIAKEYETIAKLDVSSDGTTCTVIPTNYEDDKRQVIVTASTASGMEAASIVNIAPPILPAPLFSQQPSLSISNTGKLRLNYQLDTKYKDESIISWYRCTDVTGSNAIEVAVSRFEEPLKEYTLRQGDMGYFIMAEISPKHIRSLRGEKLQVIYKQAIDSREVKTSGKKLFTDFRNVSTKNQPLIIPGFFTWKHLVIPTNEKRFTTDTSKDAWYVGNGSDGAADMTGLLQGRSAAMSFTPVGEKFGDMQLTITVVPFKTAGQGFSVAHLYMDILVKFDPTTMTGYGLRLIRTTKYHDAVDCMFVQYDHGKITPISAPIGTSAFKTLCIITVQAKGNQLIAKMFTTANTLSVNKNVVATVNISASITPNNFGSFGIQYNGGSSSMIKDIGVSWE